MLKKIKNLIDSGREGLGWDFKQQFHDNNASLVHDIICLANSEYDGDRYIIFGVSDEFKVVGITNDKPVRKQAEIVDLLRNIHFAENNTPEIQLEHLHIEDKEIAVLSISNTRYRPYYLSRDYIVGKKTVRAGVIYSRTEDSNTPLDRCSSPEAIKKMWRERFGLDLSPLDRFIHILPDADKWNSDGISKAFYYPDPIFSMEIEREEKTTLGHFWWQNTEHEKTSRLKYNLKYHDKILKTIEVSYYYSESLFFPAPENETIAYPDNFHGPCSDFYADIFFFKKNTLKHSLLMYLYKSYNQSPELPLTSPAKPPIIKLPFLILNNDKELDNLKEIAIRNFNQFTASVKQNSRDEKTRMQIEKEFSWWIFNLDTGM